MSSPMIGRPAPPFDIPCVGPASGSGAVRARLADYRGRWLAMIFYPRDYSLVCPTELTAVGDRIEEFRRLDCDVLGVSCDSLQQHQRWLDAPVSEGGLGGLPFPLASDEGGNVSQAFGVYLDPPGVALRGLFLIDPEGLVQYQVVHNLSVGRRAEEVIRVLGALRSGGMCPQGWQQDDSVLDPTRILGPGRVVAHYRIEQRLGEGTFAAVFRAFDETLHRTVALKVLKPEAATRPRAVLDEARAAAALNHPNICTIYGVDDSEGVPIIAMEYLAGAGLDRLMSHGPMPPSRIVAIMRQVASGMAAAHGAGVIHGDLKPQNILVVEEGRAKIVDFGLARRVMAQQGDPLETVDDAGEAAGITGTPGYMAPEQTRGEGASKASDVFAMGAILYEMFTGRRAFDGPNVLRALESIRSVRPAEMAEQVPITFSSIVQRALQPDPIRRDLTMREIADRLPVALAAAEHR